MINSQNGLVAIIIVNYNGFNDTKECLESLNRINYSNFEVFVVDNSSTAKPDKEVEEYIRKNSHYIRSEKNLGFSGGNNYGIREASQLNPQYYLLINNDTVVTPGFLDCLVNESREQPEAGIITGRIEYNANPGKAWFCGGELDLDTGLCRHLRISEDTGLDKRNITFSSGCLMLIPQEVIQKVGLMDEDYFLYCEDTDYCARVLQAGYKIRYVPESLIFHKVSATTGEKSPLNQYYYVRNSMYVIHAFATNKTKGYTIFLKNRLKDMIRGRLSPKYVGLGIMDFLRKKIGQVPYFQ